MVDASFNLSGLRPTFGPVRVRRAALFAGSVLFHIAILTPLALRFFENPRVVAGPDFDPPIYLDIEPRPRLPGERVRLAPAAASAGTTPTIDEVQTAPGSAATDRTAAVSRPSPLNPHLAPDAPADPSQAAEESWRVTPESQRAAVARSLRLGAVGCRAMDGRLSPSEQQLCDDRFNERAGRAGPPGARTLNASEARREAGFARDGARALAQYESRRRPLSGGVGIIGVGDCPGSNLGAGCAGAHLDPAIRQGATTVANPGLGSNDLQPMRPIRGQE
ncbi:hypothetical protein [Brevundimonas subvibrioides]|uniref:hypothetical protein n=1 Tax=Brevundimonas subvibrioides TaxID=74313 RepID=UPI0022B534B6|nr:hypothetical protein [Brevundimonas subvibrioides]